MAAQFTAVRECYAIGADDRLVAAFAPFALYGPALGIPVAVPDCDITKPASLRAEALADACAAVEATIVFAAPAALDGVLASQETLDRGGDGGARGAPPRSLGRRAGAAAHARGVQPPRSGRRAAHALRHDRGALGGGHRPRRRSRASGRGAGVCVGRPLAGVGLRIEPLPGRRRRVRRDRRQRAVAVARLRRALGDERPRPDASTRTGSSGIARATSGTSTTPGGSGSRDGSRTSSRRPTAR